MANDYDTHAKWNKTKMEYDQNGRQPKQKMIQMKDDQNGKRRKKISVTTKSLILKKN